MINVILHAININAIYINILEELGREISREKEEKKCLLKNIFKNANRLKYLTLIKIYDVKSKRMTERS